MSAEIMLETMDKVRMVLMVDPEVRDALRLESALSEKDMADLVADLVRNNFPEALAQIRRRRAQKEKSKQKD